MSAMTDVQLRIHVDESEATEIEQSLREVGATDVERVRQDGILPIVGIVVAAVIGVSALVDLIQRIRRQHQCQEIVDCRGDEVKIAKNCDRKDGSIVVVSKDKQKVEITDVPDSFDLTEVMKAALTAGADAVKSAADAAGAKAGDPQPADGGSETVTI